MAKKQKRNPIDPMDTIMPNTDKSNKNSQNNTENLNNNSVNNTNNSGNREKADKWTISAYPSVKKAVENYAADNFMKSSQVITQALMKYIPEEYFKK